MRKLSAAAVATTMAIAFYFTLFWGSEALRMLTSPSWGLDDAWRSQFVFVIGAMLGLAPLGLIKLAAFFAMLMLAVAAICAIYIVDRLRSLVTGKPDGDILEAALILIVAISILAVGPAVWSQNVELARDYTLQLALAGIAIALCLRERNHERPANAKPASVTELAAPPRGAPWYAPFR
jgi:hypothetical protein